jgi:ATP/maltotriose-dependent transcriptional regulator MalT
MAYFPCPNGLFTFGRACFAPRRGWLEGKRLEPLTARELEVLRLMAQGYSNRQIAEELVISLGTAKNHVEHVRLKLETSDRTQAVVRAIELGLIPLPGS